jgi:hypothetical protein
MKSLLYLVLAWGLVAWPVVQAYPLDGFDYTGIRRLEGYRLAQEGKVRARRLHPGALLSLQQVDLRLRDHRDLEIPPVDAEFQQQIMNILGANASRYSIAILDLTDPDNPAYAEHRAEVNFNPGSIGKLVVATGIFNELARAFPKDRELREAILRTTEVTADRFIRVDTHKVPFWHPDSMRMTHRPLRIGDKASLWEWLDWMLSPSSNAAASTVIKQLMLMQKFGQGYPGFEEDAREYFRKTPPARLADDLHRVLDRAVVDAGLDVDKLRQGGFFTSEGKRRVPAGGSKGNVRELLKFLLRLEQGKIVDEWSSREIKRLLYMTQKRIRYASSPALKRAAVYFKSGSLYKCRPEPGFKCGKYRGNKLNLLNSVAIVESPAGKPHGLYYMVVVTSNILKVNAAVAHQSLATYIQRLMLQRHPEVGAQSK